MLFWLGHVCSARRLAEQRTQGNVAAGLGIDSATIGRFERCQRWPRDVDALVAAYGDDLGLDARILWLAAVEKWMSDGIAPTMRPRRRPTI